MMRGMGHLLLRHAARQHKPFSTTWMSRNYISSACFRTFHKIDRKCHVFENRFSTLPNTSPDVQKIIHQLHLRPHPLENGYFSDNSYESKNKVTVTNNELALCDVVYWLYEEEDFAPWHRMIHSDEFWIHQYGGALEIHLIETDHKTYTKKILQQCGSVLIPNGVWFAASPTIGSGFTLFSAMCCPGFHDANCEFANEKIFDGINLSVEELQKLKNYIK